MMKKLSTILCWFIITAIIGGGFGVFAPPYQHAQAANACVSQATGNWSDAGTWTACGGVAPQATDSVTVLNTHTVTLTADASITTGSITVNAGGALTTGNYNLTTTNLTNAGTLTAGAGNTITVAGTWSNTNTFTANTSTVTFTGSSTLTNGIVSFYNLNVNGSGKTVTLGGALTVSNGLTVTAGTLAINSRNVSAGPVTIVGAVSGVGGGIITGTSYNLQSGVVGAILAGSGVNLTKTTSGVSGLTGVNTYSGTTTVLAGTLQVVDAPSGSPGAFGNATSDVLLGDTSGSADATIVSAVNTIIGRKITVQAGNSGLITLGQSAGGNYSGNITLNKGVRLFGYNPGILTISGSLSGSGLVTSNSSSSRPVVLSGDNSAASGGVTLTTGVLRINSPTALGTGTFTISSGTVIDNTSAGDITLTTNNVQAWNGNFTFTGTHSLNLGTGAVTLGVTPTVTVSGSTLTVGGAISDSGSGCGLTKAGAGTLSITDSATLGGNLTISAGTLSANNSTINVGGNWTNSGTFTSGTSTVELDGSGAQSVTANGTDDNHDFYNLTVTNASASGVTFADSLTLHTGGTFTDTTDDSKLTFNAGSTYTMPTLTVAGTAGHLVTLTSSAASSWTINPTTPSVSYARVAWSNDTGTDICAAYSLDDGNNSADWNFSAGASCDLYIATLTTDNVDYSTTGETVTVDIQVNNDTLAAVNDGYIDYVIFIDTNSNGYPDAGETYVTAACAGSAAWASGDYTFQNNNVDVPAADHIHDSQNCANTNFPEVATYTVWAKWWDGATTTYATKSTTFTSVPTLGKFLYLILAALGIFFAIRQGKLKLWFSHEEILPNNGKDLLSESKKTKVGRFIDRLRQKNRGD